MQAGSWFTLVNSDDRAVVFPLMADGILSSFVAMVSPEGKVYSLLPLGTHAARLITRLPQGTVATYIHRIEESAVLLRSSGGGTR
jgi:hypothetical protein